MYELTGQIYGVETKECRRCKLTKPLTEFNRESSSKDGWNPRCRKCYHYCRNHNRLHGLRRCRGCKQVKPLDQFTKFRKTQWLCSDCLHDRLHGDSKLCSGCVIRKPKSGFWKSTSTVDRLETRCIECKSAETKKWRSISPAHRKKERNARLKSDYGITTDQYDALLAEQDGRCGICGDENTHNSSRKNFAVDHDHSTGAVRGLLCWHCNTALGHLGDDIDGVLRALHYLRNAQERERAGT